MRNKLKVFNRLNSRSGVSLFELIIVLAIIGIVIMVAASSDLFGLNTFRKAEENSKNQFETRMASDFITKHLRYADSLALLASPQTSAPSADGYNYIYVNGGELYYYENGVANSIPGVDDVDDFQISLTANNYNLAFVVGKSGYGNKYDIASDVDVLNLKSKIAGTSIHGVKYRFTNASNVEIPLTIVGIDDVVMNIDQYSSFAFPDLIAHMSDGSDQSVSADLWSPLINTSLAGTQISYGHVPGWGADVKLTVNINYALAPVYFENPMIVNILAGLDYAPPSTIKATINGSEQMIAVTWSAFSPSFDKNAPGIYEAIGTTSISPVAGDITLRVNVNPASITGYVNNPISINRLVNEVYSTPSSVLVNLDNGSQSSATVTSWSPTPAYDYSTAGVYSASGSISDFSSQFTLKTYVYPIISSPLTIEQFKNNGSLPNVNTSSFTSSNEGPYIWSLSSTVKDIKITAAPISGTLVAKKSDGTDIDLSQKIAVPNTGVINLDLIVTSFGTEKTQKIYKISLSK